MNETNTKVQYQLHDAQKIGIYCITIIEKIILKISYFLPMHPNRIQEILKNLNIILIKIKVLNFKHFLVSLTNDYYLFSFNVLYVHMQKNMLRFLKF